MLGPYRGVVDRFEIDVPPGDFKVGDEMAGGTGARIVGIEPADEGRVRLTVELPAALAAQLDEPAGPVDGPLPVTVFHAVAG